MLPPGLRPKDRLVLLVGLLVAFTAVGGALAGGGGSPRHTPPVPTAWEQSSSIFHNSTNTSQEGQSAALRVSLNLSKEARLVEVKANLTWQDEPNSDSRHTNQPDRFRLTIEAGGANKSFATGNPVGGTGLIVLAINRSEMKESGGVRTVNITITLEDAGDQEPNRGIPFIGLRSQPDTGNAWSLKVGEMHQVPAQTKG